MAARTQTVLDRRQTFKEWVGFFRNGLIVAAIASVVLFWNSPHSVDDIVVAIVVPLIIFNCIPFLLRGLSPLLPQPPQKDLPLPPVEPVDFKTLPPERRRNMLIAIAIVVTILVCFFGGLAIFAASLVYGYLGIPWATVPARWLALLLVALSILPVITVASFIAGMIWTGKIRSSALAIWIYIKALRPFVYWPTYV